MGKPQLVQVWELKLSLAVTVTDDALDGLRADLRQTMERSLHTAVPKAFIWNVRCAQCTVRTEGDVFTLMEIAERTFMHMAQEPTGMEIRSIRTAPLKLTDGWVGYDGN